MLPPLKKTAAVVHVHITRDEEYEEEVLEDDWEEQKELITERD